MTLDYEPFSVLFEDLQKKFGKLKNRSEAHVTLVTPPEFDEVLSSFLTMKEIDALAASAGIQGVKIKPVCIGKAQAQVNGSTEATYFIVLNSNEIIDFRRKVFAAFVVKGGDPSRFLSAHNRRI